MAAFRADLHQHGLPCAPLLKLQIWRGVVDATFDMVACVLAVALMWRVGWPLLPAVLILVGNRQRALGNLLHDGAHRNLSRSEAVNDWIVLLFIAAPTFSTLSVYRRAHYAHHLCLGDANDDPDYLPIPPGRSSWSRNYRIHLMRRGPWLNSVAGQLLDASTDRRSKLAMGVWWIAFLGLLGCWVEPGFAAMYALVWMAARATVFHAITVFREMCDHFGLPRAGVLKSTRDLVSHGALCMLTHPRNNGYHLTHHLLPAVPYYLLPRAQRLFAELPIYRAAGSVYTSCLVGLRPVVGDWNTNATPRRSHDE